jgi:hypothetical protein
LNGDTNLGPARMLFGDGVIVFLLLNEARHRTVARVFGVSRQDANPVTAVAVGVLAEGFHSSATRVFGAALPSAAAMAIGAAALKEGAHAVTGEASRNTPFFSALLVFAVLGTAFGPVLRGSIRGARGSVQGVTAGSRRLRALLGDPR